MLEELKQIEFLQKRIDPLVEDSTYEAIKAIRYIGWIRKMLRWYHPELAYYDINLRDVQYNIRWTLRKTQRISDAIARKRADINIEFNEMLVAMAEEVGEE